jgi:hypothetical protein
MFIYKHKLMHRGFYEEQLIVYKWDIVLDNTVVGHITLEIISEPVEELYFTTNNMPDFIRPRSSPKANARASLYSTVDYDSHIVQLLLDFKQMANNRLLDIDEDYSPVRFIDVEYGYRGSDILC